MKILDLGCGDRKFPGSVGVDNNKAYKPDVLWDLEKIPYPFKSNSYDFIVSMEVLEHLHKPEKFIVEIERILNKNGILLLTTNNRKSLVNRLFGTYEFESHYSLQNINTFKKLVSKKLKIIEFYCLPYSNQERTDFKYTFFRNIRTIFHKILPQSLQERMMVVAMKFDKNTDTKQKHHNKII